jgi:glycine/D-amino acid oxidase-like deaminating enzyme
MAADKPRVSVLGGGVRGCSIAALLAESGQFSVTLFEKHLIGSGITSLNHGRLHCGATLWHANADETSEEKAVRTAVIRKRLRGAELIRASLPDCFAQVQPALYLIHHDLATAFKDSCAQYGIPISPRHLDAASRAWVHPSLGDWATVSVPDYGFLPTDLALRFALVASAAGALILPNHPVQSVVHRGQVFFITLADQSMHEVDAVVNATCGWAKTIDCELHRHLDLPLQFSYPEITLLLLRNTGQVPPLPHSLTIMDPENLQPTVIPHLNAYVFSASTPTSLWHYNSRSVVERALLNTCRSVFPPLKTVPAAGNDVKLVTGIYPRLDHLHPVRPFHVHSALDKSLYWVVSGGNATTTLLDACETVGNMLSSMPVWGCSHQNVTEWLARVVSRLRAPRPSPFLESLAAKMFWE